MKHNIIHAVLALLLIALFVLLSDPFMVWMPPVAVVCALIGVAGIMSVWAGFVMKERAHDERELLHRMNAGRVGYLSGIAVLTAAFVIQGLQGTIDSWIAFALIVMVVSKLIARIYFDEYM